MSDHWQRRKKLIVRLMAEIESGPAPEADPVKRAPPGLRFRVVRVESTATQLDRFFAERKLEPHGDGSYDGAEPIAEKSRRTRGRGKKGP